jgi:hypothetical protein
MVRAAQKRHPAVLIRMIFPAGVFRDLVLMIVLTFLMLVTVDQIPYVGHGRPDRIDRMAVQMRGR